MVAKPGGLGNNEIVQIGSNRYGDIAPDVKRVEKVNPSKETPALANAKIGIIPKATYGERLCSNFNSKEFLLFLIL